MSSRYSFSSGEPLFPPDPEPIEAVKCNIAENPESEATPKLDLSSIGLMFERRDTSIMDNVNSVGDLLLNVPFVPEVGLSSEQACESRLKYGSNSIPAPPQSSFTNLMKSAFKGKNLSKILVVSLVCLVIELLLRFQYGKSHKSLETYASLILVSPLSLLLAFSEALISRKIESMGVLLNQRWSEDKTLILRSGTVTSLPTTDLVVGDMFIVKAGSVIPADGICIESSKLICDESILSSNSGRIEKNEFKKGPNYLILSGSVVLSGIAKVLCLGIGSNSLMGKQKLLFSSSNDDDLMPLKVGAEHTTKLIGLSSKALVAIYILLRAYGLNRHIQNSEEPMESLLASIIWRVPFLALEALILWEFLFSPILSMIISLSFVTIAKTMVNNGILIKTPSKLEMAGRTDVVVGRDIGIITVNQMYVASATVAESEMNLNFLVPPGSNHLMPMRTSSNDITNIFTEPISRSAIKTMCEIISLVTLSQTGLMDTDQLPSLIGHAKSMAYCLDPCPVTTKWPEHLIGVALLRFVRWLGYNPEAIKDASDVVGVSPYSSDAKYASVITRNDESGYCEMLVIGVGEKLIPRLTSYNSPGGGQYADTLTSHRVDQPYLKKINMKLSSNTSKAMLTIIVAKRRLNKFYGSVESNAKYYTELPVSDLEHVATIGISNPLYSGIPGAVSALKTANVNLVLFTRNGPGLPSNILWKCGGVNSGGTTSIDAGKLASSTCQDFKRMVEHLKVVFDCGPTEARVLVEKMKHTGCVVSIAYSGRDSSDEMAARASDVMYSIGLGTSASKFMSDIVLTNNSLVNLVKCIMYGRSLISNTKRHFLYKISANTSLLISLFYSGITYNRGLHFGAANQLVLILLMNYYSACAIASGSSAKGLLRRGPEPSEQPFLSRNIVALQVSCTVMEWYIVVSLLHLVAAYSSDNSSYAEDVNDTKKSLVLCYLTLMSIFGQLHWTRFALWNSPGTNMQLALKKRKFILCNFLILIAHFASSSNKFVFPLLGTKALLHSYQWLAVLFLCVLIVLSGIVMERAYFALYTTYKRIPSRPHDYEPLSSGCPQTEDSAHHSED